MMKRVMITALLLAAGTAQAQDAAPVGAPAETAPPAAVAPPTAESSAAPAPAEAAPPAAAAAPTQDIFGALPEDKGRVVFYRPNTFVGMAIPCNVHEFEGVDVAKLGSGKYFVHVTEPGAHSYKVRSEVTDTLPLEVEAGETYFVSCTIGMGVMVGRPNLSPSDRAGFDAKAKGMKLWVPKPVKTADAKPAA